MRMLMAGLAALWAVVGGWTGARAAEQPAATVLSLHFTGSEQLLEKEGLETWRAMAARPEYEGFCTALAERIAGAMAKALTGAETNEARALFVPLAADLLALESFVEVRGRDDWALAALLNGDRHVIWDANWKALAKLPGAKTAAASVEKVEGWTVVSSKSGAATAAIAGRLKKHGEGHHHEELLTVEGTAPLLRRLAPELAPASVKLSVQPRGDGFRTEAKLSFDKDLPVQVKRWNVPTNTIRDPVIGFTAMQGIAPWLAKMEPFKSDGGAPDQLFLWSEGTTLFSVFAAIPVKSPADFIRAFATKGLPALQKTVLKKSFGQMQLETNSMFLQWTGLPIAVPFLRPAHTNDPGFVYGGTFPMDRFGSNSIPAELVSEVTSRDNLLFYEWEITSARLAQFRPMGQLLEMMRARMLPPADGAADRWLRAGEEKLGNTVSELAKTGPRELTFLRRAPIGLSAFELSLLARWVDGSAPPRPAPAKKSKTAPPPPPPAP